MKFNAHDFESIVKRNTSKVIKIPVTGGSIQQNNSFCYDQKYGNVQKQVCIRCCCHISFATLNKFTASKNLFYLIIFQESRS